MLERELQTYADPVASEEERKRLRLAPPEEEIARRQELLKEFEALWARLPPRGR